MKIATRVKVTFSGSGAITNFNICSDEQTIDTAPPLYTCGAFPDKAKDYYVISMAGSELYIQSVNGGSKGILIGGTLDGGSGFNFQNNGADNFVKGGVTGNFNQVQNTNQDGTISDRLEEARNSGIVKTNGGMLLDTDFFNRGDCNSGNSKLVVFDTTEAVTILLQDNQVLGFNVLASFSMLTITAKILVASDDCSLERRWLVTPRTIKPIRPSLAL
jgi:hypothetical protein